MVSTARRLGAHSERTPSVRLQDSAARSLKRESLFILIIFGTVLFTKDNKGN